MPCGAFSHAGLGAECLELTYASSAAGYDLLLKVEYKGRTLWDCAGSNPSDPANHPGCTVVPPGGLQAKLHLPVLSLLPCLPLTTNALATHAKRALWLCPGSVCHGASAIQECAAGMQAGVHSPLTGCKEVLQGQKQVSYAHRCLTAQENTEQWPWEAVVLIGWLIFFRYMVYIALRYKTAAPEAKHH